MILMVRADDRLIHGMVAVSWTSYLQPQTILVANDEAAKDSFKSMTMKMAKPAGVNLVIKDLDASVRALNNPVNDRKKIFLVTQSVEDALYIFERVKGITKLNIGTAGVNKKQDETYIPTLAQENMTVQRRWRIRAQRYLPRLLPHWNGWTSEILKRYLINKEHRRK